GCLKVEGRKKKPEYVATVTRGYRAFLDRLADGERTTPSPAEVQPLVQIFSRGFTGGMYGGRAGRDYVTRDQPDNRGAELGRVLRNEGGELIVSVTQPIAAGDGLGFEHPEGAAKGNTGFAVTRVHTLPHGRKGEILQAIQPAEQIASGWVVVRSSQAALLAGARESYSAVHPVDGPRVRVDIRAWGTAGGTLTLEWKAAGEKVTVKSGTQLAPAAKHGLDDERLRAQFGRLGETPFVLGVLDLAGLAPGLFLPISVLNDLRQEAVAELMTRREWAEEARLAARAERIDAALAIETQTTPAGQRPRLIAEVWRLEDAEQAAQAGADEISLDLFLRHPTPPVSRVRALVESLDARGKTLRLRTPTIVRPDERKVLDKWLALGTPLVSGHLGLVAELAAAGRSVVADYAVNCFNQHTAREIFRLGAERIVLSVELTGEEMSQVAAPWQGAGFEVFVYGRPEGMTLEHCVLSAAFEREPETCRDLCVQKHPNVELTDPAGYVFPVATDSACRNRLLHSRPVDGSEYLQPLWNAGFRNYRLVFNVPGDPVADVVATYRTMLDALAAGAPADTHAIRQLTGRAFTRGHFARAV
ncbi:MAG TPA: DUF3656 domain-containing protein, partial [Gemmatimonadales bacterium]|nr:DUF3656 domain-containing protein [Gemmatimonadales bacterium]